MATKPAAAAASLRSRIIDSGVIDPRELVAAAEQVGRRCFAMELAPRYVQVAIERWQAFTGREATRG